MTRGRHPLTYGGPRPPSGPADRVDFIQRGQAYTGTAESGRVWRIAETVVGWRLDFRDPGDARPTYAGTHGTVDAAKREASWDYGGNHHHVPRQR